MSAARKTTKLDTSFYERSRAERMADPEFKSEYERQSRAIAAIDEIVNRLDALRVEHDLSKAELARAIDKNPASVRRLLTAKGNPELATVVAIADALDADVVVVPRKKASRRRKPIAVGA
jgi:nucleotide-binding universal stress UspA family protein